MSCIASDLCCIPQLKEAVMKLQDDQSMEIQMLKRAYAVTLQGGQRLSVKLISFPPDHMVT